MTLNELLTEVDELKPNQYDDVLKIGWVSNLEAKIINDVILTHEREEEVDENGEVIEFEFNGYTEDDLSEDLIVPDPYSELYKFYLFAMIDFYNGETERYTNSMIMYNTSYSSFFNYYNKMHLPLSTPLKL